MNDWIDHSLAAHRRLDVLLDDLEKAIKCKDFGLEFGAARDALRAHYEDEDVHWNRAAAQKPIGQHAEVLELGDAVDEALATGHAQDALAIVNRFLALASHNITEEERDWFPVV